MRNASVRHIVLAMALLAAAGAAGRPARAQQSTEASRIPAGTGIRVRLLRDISSRTMEVGDRVRVQVAADDTSGLPKEAILVGRVIEASPATASSPGVVDVSFGAIELAGGWQGISAELTTGGPGPRVDETAGVQLSGGSKQQGDKKLIGYGAGAGAVLGELFRHKDSALVKGGLLGAAAGYAAERTSRKKVYQDVSLKAGAEFNVILNRPLSVRTTVSTD
jgi:hypothetical protein